jgi:hypothetical protein
MQTNCKIYKPIVHKHVQRKKAQLVTKDPKAVLVNFDYYKFAERVNGRCATFGIGPAVNLLVDTEGSIYDAIDSDYVVSLGLGIFLTVVGASIVTINENIENESVDLFEKYLGRSTMLIWGLLLIQ